MLKPTLIAAALALTPLAAEAQASCGDPDLMIATISGDKWGEELHTTATSSFNGVPFFTQFWVNHETGTFTVLQYQSPIRACIVSSGYDWFDTPGMNHAPGVPL